MSSDDDFKEIIDEFLVESHENLDRLDTDLVSLEQNPDPETLASIFRTIHTIKGTAGFLGFGTLERLTHVGEYLLSKLRDGELTVTAANTSALLRMVDTVRDILATIQQTGADDDVDPVDDLVAELELLQQPHLASEVSPPEASTPEPVDVPFGQAMVDAGLTSEDAVADAVRMQAEGDPRHIGELLVAAGEIEPESVAETLRAQAKDQRAANPADSVIRVDVGLLDNLMNLVGELVLARNQILQFTQSTGDPLLTGTSQRLNLITTELQEGVMKTRMQPIDQVWSRFPRVIRDLAVACSKNVRLDMVGRETELDRTILEAIKDPLTHLIRNSVDHGIESPAERAAAGKPEEGTVSLRAYHEGGQVNIEIADDGRGLSHERIRAKAVERQLVTPAQAATLGAHDIANLIFQPGFSTAETVTNVSGRGVGMDVVKTNIEAIGGTIDVQTEIGKGTTFRIRIPLTLAIIPALVVRNGDERYAIPQVNLLELLHIDDADGAIEMIAGTPVYRLRGDLLPIVRLDTVLRTTPETTNEGLSIVVVQADGRPFGLVVDSIMDTAEIVVKPLGATLKPLSVFAGATIMGDGHVALILDVPGIASESGVFSSAAETTGTDDPDPAAAGLTTVLLATVADRKVALLLDRVSRLEEVPADNVERAGAQSVVQYRGQIMPLVFVHDAIGVATDTNAETLPVVVHTADDGVETIGLVVDAIHDIVSDAIDVRQVGTQPGLVGSAVIQGTVVDIVDVDALVSTVAAAVPA